MRADYSNGYYYVSSDSDSLAGEESSILRVEAKEFESFIDNFILARALNNSMGIECVERKNDVKSKHCKAAIYDVHHLEKINSQFCAMQEDLVLNSISPCGMTL